MSRDYGTYPRFGLRRRTRTTRRRGMGGCAPLLLLVCAVLLALFFWLTRNTSDMESFMPREPAYEAYTTDLLQTARRVAGARVWDTIPDDSFAYDVRYRLAGGLPLPEWLVRNLFFDVCHVSGNDLENFSDAVLVTQVTRVGNLVERLHILSNSIQKDKAGGLHLRHVPGVGLYYAVRGRVLLLSRSREAVIGALTLRTEDTLPPERLEAMRAWLQEVDAVLEVRNAAGAAHGPLSPYMQHLETAQVALKTERDTLRCSVNVALSESAREQYRPVLGAMQPLPLKRPHDAMLAASWNVGMPLETLWARVNTLLGNPVGLDAGAEEENPQETPEVRVFLAQLLQVFGGQGRLMLRSFDQNEMLPAPELVALLEADTAQLRTQMTLLPAWLEGDGALTHAPYFDAETETVRMPLVGGPSLELTAAVYGGEALLGTSRPASLALMAEPLVAETLKQPGNLYLTAQPGALWAELAEAGAQLAEAGLLRGHTPDSFREMAGYWAKVLEGVESVAALAAHNNGEASLELRITMKPAQ